MDAPSTAAKPRYLDGLMGVLSLALVGGFYIDLWAHSHGEVDDTFFTPWHGLLYLAAGLFGAVLFVLALRGRREGLPWRRALPHGYGLSLIGAALFLLGGVLDLLWHEAFGFEEEVEDLLSPTHLLLATSGILMVAGPIRSAWREGRSNAFPGWLPWVFGLIALFSVLTAFTSYAHPAVETWPAETEPTGATRSALLIVDPTTGAETRVDLGLGDNVWLPATFPDGERIVVSTTADEGGALYVVNIVEESATLLWEGNAVFHHADVSPDGTLIAFTEEVIPGNADILVIPANGGEPARLTNHQGTDWAPDWSPDGSSIAFVSDREGDFDIWVMDADGRNPRVLVDVGGREGPPDWSPDGRSIAFNSDPDGHHDVYVAAADGSAARPFTQDESFDGGASWSPDGSAIAFNSNRSGTSDIYLIAAVGFGLEPVTANPAADIGWGGIAWDVTGEVMFSNTSGWEPADADRFTRQVLGVTSMLIQAALIAGVLLFMLRGGPLPVGAVTLVLTVNAALMTVFADTYWYVVPVLVAGLAGDLLAWGLRGLTRPRQARALAFVVPAIWYGSYLITLAVVEGGLGWSIHLVAGAPLLAGAVGLLMSYVVFPPRMPELS